MRDELRVVGDADEAAVDVEQADESPVERDIPDDLRRHHGGPAHQGVLPLIHHQPHFAERSEHRVADLCARDHVLAIEIASDHVGDLAVADRDQVQSRRIQRVQEDAGIAGQAPSVAAVEHFARAMAVPLHDPKIPDRVGVFCQHLGQLRLMCAQPCPGLVQGVETVERFEGGVCHDADAGGARGQADQPDPVARAHQVIGGHRAVALAQSPAPSRVVAPATDIDFRCDTEPGGIALVCIGHLQLQLPGQHPVAARGVDHPARRCPGDRLGVLDGDHMLAV